MRTVLALDPGESTGWCFRDVDGRYIGGTLPKKHTEVAQHIELLQPDVIVYETFNLYPQKAQSLAWNSFYPCEVIGIIKLIGARLSSVLVGQAPSVKKYFGGFKDDWLQVEHTPGYLRTEHVKDAYMLLKYFERNGEKKMP